MEEILQAEAGRNFGALDGCFLSAGDTSTVADGF
jgi:hypothetical protein